MPRYRRRKVAPIQLEKKTITTIIGVSSIGFSLLLLLSFFTNTEALASLRGYFYNLFGIGTIIIPVLIIVSTLPLLGIRLKISKVNIIFGAFSTMLSLLALISPISESLTGILATSLWNVTKSLVTPLGAFFVLSSILIISTFITLNTSIENAISAIVESNKKITNFIKAIRLKIFGPPKPKFVTSDIHQAPTKNPPKNASSNPAGLSNEVVLNTPGQSQVWKYPPLSLLSDAKVKTANRGNLKQNAAIIEKTLESFGITANVVEVNSGPTVTQYAIKIPMGTRLQKIMTHQNDLALALATTTGNVRIEAPIPGKSLIGIEIPNISPDIVNLKDSLTNDAIRLSKSKLNVGLGLDVSGNVIVADIAKMPHVLIAGTTGSGKSVLMNTIITSILFRASPQEVKFILVDPKRVELTEYNDIPHLLTPVIVEPAKILSALKWAIAEMDRRYKEFNKAQVRNISSYNETSGFQALPYIVIVIDELQNLMEFAHVEVENAIVRLASMARATGIHLVVATQRPSVDVITGLIKANIPTRIAFNVSSMVDSRVIIDVQGAEKLLGKGDMLYVPPDASKPSRIQGVFVSDTEIRNLITFLKKSGVEPEYTEEVISMPIGKAGTGLNPSGDRDELFEEALRTVCQHDKASASLLQRRLKIGYARAARILDELESTGAIGQAEGSKPRDVLTKNPDEFMQSLTEKSSQQDSE